MKKILILVENLPVPFDRRVWMESLALTEAGYKVSVICPQGDYAKRHEVINGISIYRYPLPSLGGIAGHLVEYGIAVPVTFFLSWVVFFREGFDAIQSANPPDFFFLIGAFYKLFGKKFIFDHHDLVPESCEARWKGLTLKLMHFFSLLAERATFLTADRVISTNESYREVALKRGKMAPDRVVVVRSGPSLNKFHPLEARAELKHGRPFLVGYLGVMGPNDGIDYLLQAIKVIVIDFQRHDIQFVLIGGGDLQPLMVKMSQEMGLQEYVHFTGRISDEEVIAWLSTCDVCVAPDPKDPLNDVSTMNKIVEYMALSKPIVAFDLKEARVSARDAAVYAQGNNASDMAQKMIEILNLPEKRYAMGISGRQRFEEVLAWEHQKKNLCLLYSSLFTDIGSPNPKYGELQSK